MADCVGPRAGRSIAGADRFADREGRLGDDAIKESGAPFDGMAKSTHCFECTGYHGRCGNDAGWACGRVTRQPGRGAEVGALGVGDRGAGDLRQRMEAMPPIVSVSWTAVLLRSHSTLPHMNMIRHCLRRHGRMVCSFANRYLRWTAMHVGGVAACRSHPSFAALHPLRDQVQT
jgi:hypothetical protein